VKIESPFTLHFRRATSRLAADTRSYISIASPYLLKTMVMMVVVGGTGGGGVENGDGGAIEL
jgi:hypothetical protein